MATQYYDPKDFQTFLDQGYTFGNNATHRANIQRSIDEARARGKSYTPNYIYSPTGVRLRARPGSGTTAASRAAARKAGDLTLGYKDASSAAIAKQTETARLAGKDVPVQVSVPQVKALQETGTEVPQYATDALAGKDVPGVEVQQQDGANQDLNTDTFEENGSIYRTNPDGSATLVQGQGPATLPKGAGQDATLTGQQVGGKFGTQQFGRVGDAVYEIMSDGSRRSVTAAEFNQKLKAQGLNLDVLPQLDPNSNISDTPGGPADASAPPSQFVQDYQGIINELGLSDIKKQIEEITKEYDELKNKKLDEQLDINNDPWLSEGTRVDRLRKLDSKYEGKESNLTAKLELFNTLHEQGVAEAKFLATGMQEDRNKMLDYALKLADAENDLGLEPGIIGEYQFAVQNGYQGSFSQYQNEDANRKRSVAGAGAGALSTAQMNSTINQIAGAFDNEQVVKNFAITQEGYNFARSLSNTTVNPADDQALIYALAKALDPNSVVREGEYATAQKYSQSWINAYGKGVTQALQGTGFLSEQARANIKRTIETKYLASKTSYDNLYQQYQTRIKQVQGGGFNTLPDYTTGGGGQKYTPGTTIKDGNTIYLVGSDGETLTAIGSAQ